MAAVYDWADPFTLTTPYGTLLINQWDPTVEGWYVLDKEGCDSGTELRVIRDDEPQISGEVVHQHYKSGYEMRLRLELWEGGASAPPTGPACNEKLTTMADYLQLCLGAILGDDPFIDSDGRIQWTPEGASEDRMLDRIRLLTKPQQSDVQGFVQYEFSVLTPFPYAMDAPEVTTNLVDGVTSLLTNDGTSKFWPVVKVNGPTNFFILVNADYLDLDGNPVSFTFDASLPGAVPIGPGHYVELGFFRNTAYLDGNGRNMKDGIDLVASDFFPLVPGDNNLTLTGASGEVLWQNAWG